MHARRRWTTWLLALAVTLGLTLPASAHPGRDPILFVHGWNGSTSTWTTMVERFVADGYDPALLFNWSYDSYKSNRSSAEDISAKISQILAATGADHVDVITHSMGGLNSRYCIRYLDCGTKVDAWVSLGGPNHGTNWANLCWTTSCVEMRPNSSFLKDLNKGDETPGSVIRYGTWWSPCDEVINPDESTIVEGAANTRTSCMTHGHLHESATVYGQVRAWVEG